MRPRFKVYITPKNEAGETWDEQVFCAEDIDELVGWLKEQDNQDQRFSVLVRGRDLWLTKDAKCKDILQFLEKTQVAISVARDFAFHLENFPEMKFLKDNVFRLEDYTSEYNVVTEIAFRSMKE